MLFGGLELLLLGGLLGAAAGIAFAIAAITVSVIVELAAEWWKGSNLRSESVAVIDPACLNNSALLVKINAGTTKRYKRLVGRFSSTTNTIRDTRLVESDTLSRDFAGRSVVYVTAR